MTLRSILLLAFTILVQDLIAQPAVHRYSNNLDSGFVTEGTRMNLNTRVADKDHPGNFYSATDAQHPYGAGIEIIFPGDLRRKNTLLVTAASFRLTDSTQQVFLVTEMLKDDSAIMWKGINLKEKIPVMNEWRSWSDTLLIPMSVSTGCRFKIYFWNEDGKAEADIDSLNTMLAEFRTHSYLVH